MLKKTTTVSHFGKIDPITSRSPEPASRWDSTPKSNP